jgi:hypothetical protein
VYVTIFSIRTSGMVTCPRSVDYFGLISTISRIFSLHVVCKDSLDVWLCIRDYVTIVPFLTKIRLNPCACKNDFHSC